MTRKERETLGLQILQAHNKERNKSIPYHKTNKSLMMEKIWDATRDLEPWQTKKRHRTGTIVHTSTTFWSEKKLPTVSKKFKITSTDFNLKEKIKSITDNK